MNDIGARAGAVNRTDFDTAEAITQREMDNLLNHQEEQIAYLVSVMRRVEDLADRISGAEPSKPATDGSKVSKGPGYIGALGSQITDRTIAISRIDEAMVRIERFI